MNSEQNTTRIKYTAVHGHSYDKFINIERIVLFETLQVIVGCSHRIGTYNSATLYCHTDAPVVVFVAVASLLLKLEQKILLYPFSAHESNGRKAIEDREWCVRSQTHTHARNDRLLF